MNTAAVRHDRDVSTLQELLDDLAHMPHLEGALCRGRSQMFDIGDGRQRAAVKAAIELCERCPARQACEQYVASLSPRDRPRGIVAGQFIKGGGVDRGGADVGALDVGALHVGVFRSGGLRPRGFRVRRIHPAPKRQQAVDWLWDLLTEGGFMRSDAVLSAALAAGIPRDRLYKARSALGVRSQNVGKHTMWTLP